MTEERRAAVRMWLPDEIRATVSGVPVRLLNLSSTGALFEHDQRFAIVGARMEIIWDGNTAALPVKIVRTAIMGRRATGIYYHTGVQFTLADPTSQGVIASILRVAEPGAAAPNEEPAQIGDDTWTRRVNVPADAHGALPYLRFRLTSSGWTREPVASSAQPEDGFTIARDATDSAALQRMFENTDGETQRKLRLAIEANLPQA